MSFVYPPSLGAGGILARTGTALRGTARQVRAASRSAKSRGRITPEAAA